MRWLIRILFIAIASQSDYATAQTPESDRLQNGFQNDVLPILKKYCLNCHGISKSEGALDLTGARSVEAVVANLAVWEIVQQRIEDGEMPPEESDLQPSNEEREFIVRWIQELRAREANRNAGDPGVVLAHRLSGAEFDNTIRDLTGVDIRPTKDFPVDPSNEAGFDNSGESLTMSPALLKKYLNATRLVADHAVLTPRGILFSPHPMVSETDRDKFCVQRIVSFYERHKVEYADYFFSLWKFRHRQQYGREKATLEEFARESQQSLKYLTILWETLHQPNAIGPGKELQAAWSMLPSDIAASDSAKESCQKLGKLVEEIRADLEVPIARLKVNGISEGSQPLILWWNQQVASSRRTFPGDGDDAALDQARHRFCQVFPSAFSISSRGHYSDGKLGAGVRLLSAGFHLMQGYFRDDQPLCELVLDDAQRTELDQHWQDLSFVTLAPIRQYKDFLFLERAEPPRFAGGAEFDFARPEDKDVTSPDKVSRLRHLYLLKAKENGASSAAIQAIEDYFDQMNQTFRWIEKATADAEPFHIDHFLDLAERAWRRPINGEEKADLIRFYRVLRTQESLSHEEAIRDSIASVLMSPYFSYRFDVAGRSSNVSRAEFEMRPLTDYELASRLSYFLWASMPDQELLSHAAAGDLHEPAVLAAQSRRMLKDKRIRGLATEFLGNWLEFRRFEEHNAVDRDRFPVFNSELRSAMFEEPVRFFVDLAEQNGSVLNLLTADYTFVNRMLASHYGIEAPELNGDRSGEHWIRLDKADKYGRGGLLPMSVFLTKNSPGLRTSPVKRGYWVVRRLLGEHIPAPPANVPELPEDEAKFGELTLSDLLARHRDHVACVGCHQRFDSMGLVFEGYGPIGERRQLDLGGRPVQTLATFPDGSEGDSIDDLKAYLRANRQDDFVNNFVRKLFVFALGRGLLLSDTQAIDNAKRVLAENQYRLGDVITSIVTSPQFVNKRVDSP